MTALPDKLIETPGRTGAGPMMDVLSDILASLRLTGGVVIDAQMRGDFCLLSQFTPDHCAPFFPMPETLIGYHYVRSGSMLVQVDGMPPVAVEAGEIAFIPRNDPHLLARRSGLPPIDASDVVWVTDGIHRIACGNGPETTELWCGFLGTAKSSAHPLLDALPPVLKVDIKSAQEEWVEASLRFVAEQAPAPDIVSRLAESFVVQAIREYLAALPPGASGWLDGLRDPAVARALSIIHTRYAEDIDVEGLAREAGVSRSVLGERFAELLGEPPMRYCARWRMRVAANMLRDGKHNTANVAYAVGFNSEAAFNRAFKREYGEPPATWRRRAEAEEQAKSAAIRPKPQLPRQQVRFCEARDGTRLAYSRAGEGPPLVKTANWLNHIEFDWESPLWRHWLSELTRGHCLIRYDERGNGLSDWDTPEISFEAFVDDLETVVDCAGLDQFDLLGISQGTGVSIAYAVRHPERVRRMVLLGGYACGWRVRADPPEVERREAMLALARSGWGSDNPAYRQLFTGLYVPEASEQQTRWFNDMQRKSASAENAVRLQKVFSTIDVRELLPQVKVPTLVLHSRNDQAIPLAAGKEIADGIPGARFVALDSQNHILLEEEPAWGAFVNELRGFLAA